MAMENPRRFEIQLPAERRQELDNLARRIGTNSADLAKIAIAQFLDSRLGAGSNSESAAA